MKPLVICFAATPFLAGCALLDGPLALGEIGLTPDVVLLGEREDLEAAHSRGLKMEMAEVSGLEDLRCISAPYGRDTPNCRYRLRYRKPDGGSAALTRRDRFFKRGEDGQWERVIIVRGE